MQMRGLSFKLCHGVNLSSLSSQIPVKPYPLEPSFFSDLAWLSLPQHVIAGWQGFAFPLKLDYPLDLYVLSLHETKKSTRHARVASKQAEVASCRPKPTDEEPCSSLHTSVRYKRQFISVQETSLCVFRAQWFCNMEQNLCVLIFYLLSCASVSVITHFIISSLLPSANYGLEKAYSLSCC